MLETLKDKYFTFDATEFLRMLQYFTLMHRFEVSRHILFLVAWNQTVTARYGESSIYHHLLQLQCYHQNALVNQTLPKVRREKSKIQTTQFNDCRKTTPSMYRLVSKSLIFTTLLDLPLGWIFPMKNIHQITAQRCHCATKTGNYIFLVINPR